MNYNFKGGSSLIISVKLEEWSKSLNRVGLQGMLKEKIKALGDKMHWSK